MGFMGGSNRVFMIFGRIDFTGWIIWITGLSCGEDEEGEQHGESDYNEQKIMQTK